MSLIDHFLSNTYTVKRKAAGKYIDGFWHEGKDEVIQVRGSLQPTSGKDLKLVEEGNRLKQLYKFYTDQPLVVLVTGKTLKDSDRIIVNGESYKVISQQPWQGLKFDLPHYKSIVAREPEQ